MATKNFRSTVLEPTSEFAYGDKLRFTALETVGEVLKGSFSETTIGEDGVYSVDLQYGKHRIDYKPYEGVWRHFADVEVSADTLSTTLQDLALASVPVTDETILVLQGILADAEAAKTESASMRDEAAASAAVAVAGAEAVSGVINESSFFKRYSFSLSEYYDAGSTGNYTLVKVDEFEGGNFEFPSYYMSLRGTDVVSQAVLIPLSGSSELHAGNEALFRINGFGDLRVFFGVPAAGGNRSLYVATRNTKYNNASVSVNVSTCKKLTTDHLGSVNIDTWIADNPSISETTKIPLGV